MAVHDKIKELIGKHKRIVFNGNGYSDEWVEEAARRGLPNIKSMVDAVEAYKKPENIALFEKYGVLSKVEMESRAEIYYENYAKQINIETKTMLDMARKQIIPAVMKYAGDLAKGANEVKAMGMDVSVQENILSNITMELKNLVNAVEALDAIDDKARAMEDMEEAAKSFHTDVVPAMEAVRVPADKLEELLDKEYWPFPQYEDMLFYA